MVLRSSKGHGSAREVKGARIYPRANLRSIGCWMVRAGATAPFEVVESEFLGGSLWILALTPRLRRCERSRYKY
jgi:hypothetical protein